MRLVDMDLIRSFLITGFRKSHPTVTVSQCVAHIHLEAFNCIGQTGLAIGAVSYIAISLPFIVAVLYFVQRFYIRTSRQLRLLE